MGLEYQVVDHFIVDLGNDGHLELEDLILLLPIVELLSVNFLQPFIVLLDGPLMNGYDLLLYFHLFIFKEVRLFRING